MKFKELQLKLESHRKWLNHEDDGIKLNLQGANLQHVNLRGAELRHADLRDADLQGADLQHTDLQGADLQSANLRGVNLQGADLQHADLDFSCLPLWCGGINFKIDEKQAKQLMYHVINLMQYSNIDIPKSHKSLYKWLSDSHIVIKHNLPVLKEEATK